MADYDDTGIASNTILNTAFDDDTGGIAVDMQDQTTPSLDFFFIQPNTRTGRRTVSEHIRRF